MAGPHESALDALKSRMNVGSRDLTNSTYDKKMILLFDLRYAFSEIFEDSNRLTGLIRNKNIYVLPKEVKYDDYITQGYNALVKKHLKKEKIINDPEEKQRAHTLIEVEVKNLNSVIRGTRINNSMVCFAAIEPLQAKETLRSYVTNVVKHVQKSQEEYKNSKG